MVESIEDITDPRVQFFHGLKGNHPRILEHNVIVVEGERPVARLLASDLSLHTLLMERVYYSKFSDLLARHDLTRVNQLTAARKLMEQIIGYDLHHGVMAVAARPKALPIEALEPPIVAFNGIADAENIGALVRTSFAFGVTSFLVDQTSCDPYLRRAIRVSMGAALLARVCYTNSLSATLRALGRELSIVAVELSPDAIPIERAALSPKSVFVLGQERFGIAPEILQKCHSTVSVPMDTTVISSLNVNAAAAVVLSRLWQIHQEHT